MPSNWPVRPRSTWPPRMSASARSVRRAPRSGSTSASAPRVNTRPPMVSPVRCRDISVGTGRSRWSGRPIASQAWPRSCCCPATALCWPRSGCRGASGCNRVTSAPVTCCRPPRMTRDWCPATPIPATPRSRRSASNSDSAASGCCPATVGWTPPSVGRTATSARTARWPSTPRPGAAPAASSSPWPDRCRPVSASAPTSSPAPTAGWSRSSTAVARTPRSSRNRRPRRPVRSMRTNWSMRST